MKAREITTVDDEFYVTENGGVLIREYRECPDSYRRPAGRWDGQWVYRAFDGSYIDYSNYRNDLFEKYDLEVVRA